METVSRLKLQRFAQFALPILAAVLGLLNLIPAFSRMKAVERDLANKRAMLAQNQATLNTLASSPRRSWERAVALANDEEPVAFLNTLSSLLQQSNVELAGLQGVSVPGSSSAATSSTPSSAAASQPATAASGVREITETLTVEGTYGAILNFVSRLETGERIVAVSNLRMNAGAVGYPRLTANFGVTRFVSSMSAPTNALNVSAPANQR